jgi:hypothetical protein
MKELINHVYIATSLFIAVIIGFFADFMNEGVYYILGIVLVLTAFVFASFDNAKRRKLFKNESVPIPIVISVDSHKSTKHVFDNFIKEIEKKSKINNLEEGLKKYLNVVRDDLIFEYRGDLYDRERLISFMQIIRYGLNKIELNTQTKIEFHLAYYKRPAIGFLVGYIFENDGLVIYQNNPDGDIFDEVAKIDKRNYKTEVKEFTKFTLSEDKRSDGDSVLVAIKAASHEIALNVVERQKYANVVQLRANHVGTIELDEDWILYAREIFTLLNRLQTEYKKITIIHSMPEALAVLVGMSIGNYWNIQMTQFDEGEYKELIELGEVKCYF